MKYLITGINGQLGYDIDIELKARGCSNILAPTSSEMDITNEEVVKKTIREYKPDVIFHCAAFTDVDRAETDKEICYNVNVNGTKYIAEIAKEIGAKMIYISTDYVFDGTKDGLYEINDIPNPINVYGNTKYEAEKIVSKILDKYFIVRISWVFGLNAKKNFIKTMIFLSETKKELNVVSDQIGSPTYTKDLAHLLVDMSNTDKYGIYHATNEGYTSWADYSRYIFNILDKNIIVNNILSKDYIQKAKRPLNSKLSKKSLDDNGFNRLPDFHDSVKDYIKNIRG